MISCIPHRKVKKKKKNYSHCTLTFKSIPIISHVFSCIIKSTKKREKSPWSKLFLKHQVNCLFVITFNILKAYNTSLINENHTSAARWRPHKMQSIQTNGTLGGAHVQSVHKPKGRNKVWFVFFLTLLVLCIMLFPAGGLFVTQSGPTL